MDTDVEAALSRDGFVDHETYESESRGAARLRARGSYEARASVLPYEKVGRNDVECAAHVISASVHP